MTDGAAGHLVESFARHLVGVLGVKDFVYRPVVVPRGENTREVSDGLLIAGDRGLILQVKSRAPEAAANDTPEKARSWCLKNAAAAVRQANGSRRSLGMSVVTVESLRGFERTLDSSAAQWPAVVIIDHPGAANMPLPEAPNTFYISLSDWATLNRFLRSTYAIIDYVGRALSSGLHVDLGNEQARYARLAAADVAACTTPTMLPTLPPIALDGPAAVDCAVFDGLIELVADPAGATGWDATQYLLIVEALDRVSPMVRVGLGAKFRTVLDEVRRTRSRRGFLAADASGRDSHICFLFDVDTEQEPDPGWHMTQTAMYGILRREQAISAGADPAIGVLAVGVEHNPALGERYTFFYSADNDLMLPAEVRADAERQFGIFDGRTTR